MDYSGTMTIHYKNLVHRKLSVLCLFPSELVDKNKTVNEHIMDSVVITIPHNHSTW